MKLRNEASIQFMTTPYSMMEIAQRNQALLRNLQKEQAGSQDQNGEDSGTLFRGMLDEAARSSSAAQPVSEDSPPSSKAAIELLLKRIELRMNGHLLRILSGETETEGAAQIFEEVRCVLSGYVPEPEGSEETSIPVSKEQKPDTPSSNGHYDTLIRKASETYGVDAELIKSVIKVESNFKADSTSPKGAMGLMQLMPATARELGVKDYYNPEENIMGGTRYLKGLLDRYQGNVKLALAAYNWGMGNVEKNPGKMPPETRNYVARVTANYSRATEV
ncbi:lytic transglycosylase domain-containing protein [Syntrophus sp. (in: bacteria)]|uniref:lytic transglycosylase domain-containing protein n=1 Tax=Syntrophus sp. (in: bacteria) TaxID=48412 RepID=UPI00345E2947